MVRKGIPASARGEVWTILSRSHLLYPTEDYEGRRSKWMRELLTKKLEKEDLGVIVKDVPRTIASPASAQKALFAVLKCITINSPETGYVQGMNYIASTLMKYTTPENSFMMMISLFEEYGVKEWFKPGMVGLKKDFYILLSLQKKYMPALFKKMAECYYYPSVYAQKWFITLFSAFFQLELVSRIWDIYLVEGRKTIFRVALAIMKINENELMKADQCRIFTIFDDY